MTIPKPEDPVAIKMRMMARAIADSKQHLHMTTGRRVALRYAPEFTGWVTRADARSFSVSYDSTPHRCGPKQACPHPRNARGFAEPRARYEYPASAAHCFIDPPDVYQVTLTGDE